VFSIERCQNTTTIKKCASPSDIEKFVEDVTIDYWAVEDSMELAKLEGEPIFRDQRILN